MRTNSNSKIKLVKKVDDLQT